MKKDNPSVGCSEHSRVLIHIDDLGMCGAVNKAAFELFAGDIVKSGSVMLPGPSIEEVARYAQDNPSVDLGIHITLNSEWDNYRWKPLTGNSVSSLTDKNGYFWKTPLETLAHAKSEDIITEISAQIDRAIELGITPTHMDFHKGTALLKTEWVEIVISLSQQYGIPLGVAKWSEEFASREIAPRGFSLDLAKVHLDKISQNTISYLDHFYSLFQGITTEERYVAYIDLFQSLPKGVSQIVIHPAHREELNTIINNASTISHRHSDYCIFKDPNMKQVLEKLCVEPIGWKDLV